MGRMVLMRHKIRQQVHKEVRHAGVCRCCAMHTWHSSHTSHTAATLVTQQQGTESHGVSPEPRP